MGLDETVRRERTHRERIEHRTEHWVHQHWGFMKEEEPASKET